MKILTAYFPFFSKRKGISDAVALGSISLVMMVLAGSVLPVFGKKLTTTFSPLSLLFISEMLGGLFVLMSFGLLPILKKVQRLKRHTMLILALHGITTGVIAPYLWFVGLHRTTAVNAQLFSRSEMIFLLLLSCFFLREKISKNQILSLSIIFLGVAWVALEGFTVGIEMNTGDALILCSALTYAFGGTLVKKHLRKVHPEFIIFMRALSATAFFFCSSPFVSQNFIAELHYADADILYALFIYGFVGKFLGIYSFHEAIETLKVSTVSMGSTLSIVGAMVFATLYLGEHIYSYQMVGALLIVAGVVCMQYTSVHANRKVHEHFLRQHHRHHL